MRKKKRPPEFATYVPRSALSFPGLQHVEYRMSSKMAGSWQGEAVCAVLLFKFYMGGCQNHGPFLGTLNIRGRIIIGTQKETIILTTTHINVSCWSTTILFEVC